MDENQETNQVDGLADCPPPQLPNTVWILYDGDVHVTNDESLLVESRECSEEVEDDAGNKLAAKRVGRVYLQLDNGLFIGLNDVRLCPTAAYNMVSENLISKEHGTLRFQAKQIILMVKQLRENRKIMYMDFAKKVGQKKIIFTKQPSFDSLPRPARAHRDQLRARVRLPPCDGEELPPLHKSETPWKPSLRGKRSNAEPVDLFKKVRSLLNKITPSNAEKLIVEEFCRLKITTIEQLEKVVEAVFQKAIRESIYCDEYAMLIKHMYNVSVQDGSDRTVKFGTLLLEKAQTFFETQRNVKELENFTERRKEIDSCTDEEKKLQLLDELDDEILFSKKKGVGNIKLSGALYLQDVLRSEIIDLMLEALFAGFDDVSLEYLCALLKKTGKQYENSKKNSMWIKLDQQMSLLEKIMHENKIASRTKFLIMDVLECRANGWNLRQFEEAKKPTKITRSLDDKKEKDPKREQKKEPRKNRKRAERRTEKRTD